MISGHYGIVHINLRHVRLFDPNAVILTVEEAQLRNASFDAELLQFHQRLDRIQRIWLQKALFPERLANLLEEHEQAVRSHGPLTSRTERLVSALQRAVSEMAPDLDIPGMMTSEDVLPSLIHLLNAAEAVEEPQFEMETIPPEEIEIRRREVKKRRHGAAVRPAGRRFRRELRAAYRSTCVVCGLRLPPVGRDSKPGVDAAHILPWGEFDLDIPSNGLCLCKLHHWAFDEGLIEIRFENGKYLVAVPEEAERRIDASREAFSMECLRAYAGPINFERLPAQLSQRPNPQLLQRLREYLHPE